MNDPIEPKPTKYALELIAASNNKPKEEIITVAQKVEQPTDIQVCAETPDQMKASNLALIEWCKHKIAACKSEANELKEAYRHAVQRKWKSSLLKKHADIAKKRVDYFHKIKTALENGFYIVPNFPVSVFALRTTMKKPFKFWSTETYKSHTQPTQSLTEGEGEYKNPFPLVRHTTIRDATATQDEVIEHYATSWKELEFPISMSKPQIMEATTNAMALKIFDDFGILPEGKYVGEGARPPKRDPLIVARIRDPRSTTYDQRFITFVVAWALDTKVL